MISVIIPAYNCEAYIERCIKSISASTFTDYEIIVVDDGSTDKTPSVLEELSKKNDKIIVMRKENGGSASARNAGLKLSKGEYLVFVDADDYVEKNYLMKLYNVASENRLDIAECDFNIIRDSKERQPGRHRRNDIKRPSLAIVDNLEKIDELYSNETYLKSVVLWNKIFKKTLFEGVEFTEGRGIDDEYVIYRLLYKAKKVGIIHEKLYNYCINSGSQMRNAPSLKKLDGIDVLEKQILFFKNKKIPKKTMSKIMFRYYKTIMDDVYYVKRFFPEEKDILKDLVAKRKGWHKALKCSGKTNKEKAFMVMTRFTPRVANYLRDKYMGKNIVINNEVK